MTKTSLFGGKTLDTETASSEELRQSLNGCTPEWRTAVLAELDRRGEPFANDPGCVPWPFEAPVSPYPTRTASPWNSPPGTPARHDEEEETIHGVN